MNATHNETTFTLQDLSDHTIVHVLTHESTSMKSTHKQLILKMERNLHTGS